MFEVRFQYKTQILVGLQKKQNLHISELVQLIFDLNIKTERFSIKIAPKHIIFDYSWDKKETNKLFRLVCLLWLGWQDSNLRMQQSKCCVLPLDDTPILSLLSIQNILILKRFNLPKYSNIPKRYLIVKTPPNLIDRRS